MAERWVQRHPVAAGLATSGVSVATASSLTNPFDVVKVRLQMQARVGAAGGLGMVGTFRAIVASEGISTLWHGVTPAIARGMFYGAVRIGLYKPLKEQLPIAQPTLQKLTAGCMSGAAAAAIFNPMDLVKTRLQAKNATRQTPWTVTIDVVKQTGVQGLWRGTLPSAVRAGILTASQCATYDAAKGQVRQATGWDDGFPAQLVTSMVTGLVTTTATAPVDTVKSRVFVEGESGGRPLSIAGRIMASEGPMGFFRGWSAQYLRLGPQTMITFLVMERIRFALCMDTF